ncbi:MAG: hypothetical protein DCC65_10175 [Planctomycetota bacterium]|nr:MAG: hypothetical protein DCC65_10175 [Planctomycetota bacterium]
MRRIGFLFTTMFLGGYLGTQAIATIIPIRSSDCDGCPGNSTTLTCESGGGCPGSITMGVNCSKCCDGTTCYKKEGYSSAPDPGGG